MLIAINDASTLVRHINTCVHISLIERMQLSEITPLKQGLLTSTRVGPGWFRSGRLSGGTLSPELHNLKCVAT